MWTHASDADLMDVVEGAASPRARAHVVSCPRCSARVEEARGGLLVTAEGPIPEPSPLYWDALRRNVIQSLDAAGARPQRSLWAAAAVAAAAVVVALVVAPLRTDIAAPNPTGPAALPAWSALPPSEDDPGFDLLAGAAPQVTSAAPVADCPSWAECVASLSDDESLDLAAALKQELRLGKTL